MKRRGKDVFYWKNRGEVDFVVKGEDNSLTAINVCYSDEIPEREINALLESKEKLVKVKEMLIITRDTEKSEQSIKFIPLWKYLLLKNR